MDNLTAELADAFRKAYLASEYDRARTGDAAGRVLVKIRAQIVDPKTGKPDWKGRTWEYRSIVSEALGLANVDYDERLKFMARMRYHVSKIVREELEPDELAEEGLKAEDSVARARAIREEARKELSEARRIKSEIGLTLPARLPTTKRDKAKLRKQLEAMLAALED